MSLKQLNDKQREVDALSSNASRAESTAKGLAGRRNSDKTLVGILLQTGWSGLSDSEKNALHAVINECKHDLIRLAELRLEAEARTLKIRAAQSQAIIDASILPIGIEEPQS